MSETTYNLLIKHNVDIEKGKEKFNGNIDLYLIFLRKFLANDDIKDLIYHLKNENLTQAIFTASALMAESEELFINGVSQRILQLRKEIDSNDLANANLTAKSIESSIDKIKEILS